MLDPVFFSFVNKKFIHHFMKGGNKSQAEILSFKLFFLFRQLYSFAVPVVLGNQIIAAVFDTGAPMSMVDKAFVFAHPELFSDPLPSDGAETRELVSPLSVNGLHFSKKRVSVYFV